MTVKCLCGCENEFKRKVQEGVDNACTTKIWEFAGDHELETVVLVSGDGDFKDVIKLC